MSDVAPFTPKNKLWTTPLRDLARLRITGRLDWKSRLRATDLPAGASGLILRVVQRTRLWRLEQAAVADELIAHFTDGLATGNTAAELVDRFGDERTAARLIRRAKKRSRPMPWHALVFTIKSIGIFLGIYALLLVRFVAERPSPTVDYVAQFNAPAAATAVSDRAWPLYRQAVLACSEGMRDHQFVMPKALNVFKDKLPWEQQVGWLNQHGSVIEAIRKAAEKPVMGFILDGEGTVDDPSQMPCNPGHHLANPGGILADPSELAYYRDCEIICTILDLDTKRATLSGDGKTVEADLMALLGLSRQLQTDLNSQGRVWNDREIVGRLQWILVTHGQVLRDDQLIRIAHAISGPKVAADLHRRNSQFYLADILQQIFTDDGNVDGHLTLEGSRTLSRFFSNEIQNDPISSRIYFYAAPVPLLTVSRRQLQATFDQQREQREAVMRLPLRLANCGEADSQAETFYGSYIAPVRYGPWGAEYSRGLYGSRDCEECLGERDGALVGIALELYHRRHGKYPESLGEMTPDLLPEIPVDRITGDPIKYRIIDGKPVVYSVGLDRIDDGGKPPKENPNTLGHCWAADWTHSAGDIDKHDPYWGDWVIYPALPLPALQ